MARVTIEDCLKSVGNRFKLVLLASKRARQLALGSVEATVRWENDKPSVVALREVASGKLFLTEEGEIKAANDQDTSVESNETTSEPSLHVVNASDVSSQESTLSQEQAPIFPLNSQGESSNRDSELD